MRTYQRVRIDGACCFFTVNLAERKGNHLLIQRIEHLREAFRQTRQDHPFEIDAIVILLEHLHCIWQLPPEDSDYSTRWRLIKARFSMAIPKTERISKAEFANPNAVSGSGDTGSMPYATLRIIKSCGLYQFQSGQAWPCQGRQGMAALIISPLGKTRLLRC